MSTAEQLQACADECDDIAEQIRVLSEGFTHLLNNTKLNERALMMLLHHACPPDDRGKKLSRRTIARVLEGIERMPELFLKPDA